MAQQNTVYMSKENEDGDKEAPKGFEKFLKRTRKGVTKTEDKKEKESSKGPKKDKEEEEMSEEEEPEPVKQKEKKAGFAASSGINDFFF